MRVARAQNAQNAQTSSALAAAKCAQKHVAVGNGQAPAFEFVAHALDEIAGGDVLIATGPEIGGDLSEQHVYARRLASVGRRRRGPNLFEVWLPDIVDVFMYWPRRTYGEGSTRKDPQPAERPAHVVLDPILEGQQLAFLTRP